MSVAGDASGAPLALAQVVAIREIERACAGRVSESRARPAVPVWSAEPVNVIAPSDGSSSTQMPLFVPAPPVQATRQRPSAIRAT